MSCITPLEIQHDGAYYLVPCGKCPTCLKRRTSAWSFRLMEEDRHAKTSYFITLTYENEQLPRTKSNYKTLVKEHFQLFMKRLRKLSNCKIKYYAVGEYGEINWRPHYHAIIFNADINQVIKAWSYADRPIGYVHYGTVTSASVGYVLKYLCKPKRIPVHSKDDRLKEFSLMSKRLGMSYLTQQMIEYHKADLLNRMCCVIEGGKKISMPRYFKDKIYNEVERNLIAKHSIIESLKRQEEYEKKMYDMYGEYWMDFKVEQDIVSFEKMYKNSIKNRVL